MIISNPPFKFHGNKQPQSQTHISTTQHGTFMKMLEPQGRSGDALPPPERGVPVISNPSTLLLYGVCRVPLPATLDANRFAKEFSQVTPEIILGQGDGEYAFYRNILEEETFPFDLMLDVSQSEIARAILRHFPVVSMDELQLDDAFCVHYNMDQDDTTGAKHKDPNDITVNLCLEKSKDTAGSYVSFYGTKQLNGVTVGDDVATMEKIHVPQEAGYATIHFGDHPHETTALQRGRRTNIVLTYKYKDAERSGAQRACYF